MDPDDHERSSQKDLRKLILEIQKDTTIDFKEKARKIQARLLCFTLLRLLVEQHRSSDIFFPAWTGVAFLLLFSLSFLNG
jgi:hypothetical protein